MQPICDPNWRDVFCALKDQNATMATTTFQFTGNSTIYSPVVWPNIKENVKAHITGPL